MNAKVDIFPILEAWDELRAAIQPMLSAQVTTLSARAEALDRAYVVFGQFLSEHTRRSDAEVWQPLKRTHDFLRASIERDQSEPADVIAEVVHQGETFAMRRSDLLALLGAPPAKELPRPPAPAAPPKRRRGR